MKTVILNILTADGLWYLATCALAGAATPVLDANYSPGFTLDGVRLEILVVLVAGIPLVMFWAALDRFHSLCRQAMRLVEVSLQARSWPTTTVVVPDGTRTATMPAADGISGSATEEPPVEAPPSGPTSSPPKLRSFRLELAAGLLPKIHGYITAFLQEHERE